MRSRFAYAIRENRYDEVVSLINDGVDVNHVYKDYTSETPIIKACRFGHLAIAKKLHEHGADVNVDMGWPSNTCLNHAGNLSIFKWLVEDLKLNVTKIEDDDDTMKIIQLFARVCFFGRTEVLDYLTKKDAEDNSLDKDYIRLDGCLGVAAECGHLSTVKLLLELNAKLFKELRSKGYDPSSEDLKFTALPE